MRYLLKDIQDYMENDDGFRRRAANYTRSMKSEELAFMNEAIVIIKGIMMGHMLSQKHTNSDSFEKDVEQRTFYNTIQILDFLANPEGWFREKNKAKQVYANTVEKFMRQFKSGGRK